MSNEANELLHKATYTDLMVARVFAWFFWALLALYVVAVLAFDVMVVNWWCVVAMWVAGDWAAITEKANEKKLTEMAKIPK